MIHRARILVIDDEAGMLRAVERILTPDHDVTTCASPVDGVELARAKRPDLVICDISMPRLDGFAVMEAIRRDRADVDVILMTGLSEPEAHLVRAIRERAFYFIEKPFNREVMRALVDRCLEMRRLRESEQRHAARVNRELAEGRAFQQSMLPAPRATVNGVEIVARYVASSELCGDIFDYAPAGDGCAALLVADVSGHGVSASLLTAVVKAAFRSSSAEGYAPAGAARRVIEGIASFSDRRFVTMFAGLIDLRRRQMRYVNAGHPAAIIRRGGGDAALARLEATGAMLSPAFVDESWPESSVPLADGDELLLYTDGVTDAHGPSGNFGEARLLDLIRSSPDLRGEALLERIIETVRAHAHDRHAAWDDLTLMSARVGGDSNATAS